MLAEFCISSLVIVCLVKSFYELNIRFFGPAVSAGAASKRSNRFFAPERSVASAGLAFKRAAEAGTLPRSPRFIWRAGTPEAPLQWPSGTDTMLLFAALARDHAKLTRRLALNARIAERW